MWRRVGLIANGTLLSRDDRRESLQRSSLPPISLPGCIHRGSKGV